MYFSDYFTLDSDTMHRSTLLGRNLNNSDYSSSPTDIVVADPTRSDLVERAARHDLVAATNAERRKETHYRDRAAGTKFVPFCS